MVFIDPNGCAGILNRIVRIKRILRKCNQRCGIDPGIPTPGVRMTVVYTNSLKITINAKVPFRMAFSEIPSRIRGGAPPM